MSIQTNIVIAGQRLSIPVIFAAMEGDVLIMSRLIDADVLDAKPKCTYRYFQVAGDIAEAPTVDPIHATGRCYCRECKSLYKSIDPLNGHVSYRCSNPYGLQGFVLPHFYCVHGFMDKEEQTDDRE